MDAQRLAPIPRLFVPGRRIRDTPHLAAFLPEVGEIASDGREPIDAVAGWGFKPTAARARSFAAARGLPYIALEDGFFRSVGLGEAGAPTLSLVADDLGIYYDARRPSRLEAMLAGSGWETPELIARAETCIARIVATGLSKTNLAPAVSRLPLADRPRVLIVDQTEGDAAIAGGLAAPESFVAMLAAARAEHPDADLMVRRHPAVAAGLKRGCLPDDALAGATLLDPALRLAEVLAAVDAVYVVTSLTGFEALLRGLPVRCFGAPFYAGWGLTRDEVALPRRGKARSTAELFAAACMRYTRYVDPLTGRACPIETALDRLLLFRDRAEAAAGLTAAIGFSRWKRAATRAMLASPRGETRFYGSVASADRAACAAGGRVMLWGGKETGAIRDALDHARAPVVRMEDGFVRSAGLGSDFNLAGSVVLDDLGIYYDATRPSRLEATIEAGGFAPDLLARAAALREQLVTTGVTKYNVGERSGLPWPADGETVLVVGQVEDDRSVALGCADIRTNAALLAAVRADHPDAWIAYKPHPDVVAGNRVGAVPPEVLRSADRVVDDRDLAACLVGAERLATMTSLSGFEALLRGVPCSTYGRPFYAGWGLTDDHLTCPRRTRRATLDELVAAALILYPIYQDPASGLPCPPEHLVDLLATARAAPPARRRWRYWQGLLASLSRRAPPRF